MAMATSDPTQVLEFSLETPSGNSANEDSTEEKGSGHQTLLQQKRLQEHSKALERGIFRQTSRTIEVWSKPEESWTKINTDASIMWGQGTSLGAIIRDREGKRLNSVTMFLSQEIEVDVAEALVCKVGLLLAHSMGIQKIILETDSAIIFNKMKSTKPDFSYLGRIVEEIKLLSSSFCSFIPSYVRRSANSVAHHLAHFAFSLIDQGLENSSVPEHVSDIIALEVSS
ncbi:hypothetical protein DH2020_027428 [Rehmannia glutinosa]|uniref:RNase H type-1 domain-containing protein n=1 Tax=Rehmannia glutinosa TaxID=99300 RepID=A0ABR0VXS4_REHGL